LCDDRRNAIIQFVAEVELHDEVVEWLATLDNDDRARMLVVLDRLGSLGSAARMPMSKALGDGLFELRISLGSTARRVTYRFARDGRIILLTTFRKQRDNKRTEIDRARKAAKRCAEQNP
jgi:phage-related protein